MTVTLRSEPTFEEALYVAENLRERDRREIFATRWEDDPNGLALDTVAAGGFSWVASYKDRPVAVIGATPRWPKVWTAWAYGTDEWPRVVRRLTKHVRRFMMPALRNAGAIRVDCIALEEHHDARRWLTALGAQQEKTLASWGRNGETFVGYSWT